jgi:hypothetical protein
VDGALTSVLRQLLHLAEGAGRSQTAVQLFGPVIGGGAVADEDEFGGVEETGDVGQVGDAQGVQHLDGGAAAVGERDMAPSSARDGIRTRS